MAEQPWLKDPVVDAPWLNDPIVDDGSEKSPIDLGKVSSIGGGYFSGLNMEVDAPGQELASKGIDVTTGAPTGRMVASFSKDENYAAQYLKKALSEYYGGDIQIRKGPESGEIEFLNPGTNRWTLADEAASSVADFADMTGHTIPVGLGAAGFMLGSIAGPAGEYAGTAVGAGFGEAARLKIGEKIGANESLTSEEMASQAVSLAAWEVAFQVGGAGLVQLAKFVRQFISPPPMSADEARIALIEMGKSRQLAADVEALSGQEFAPTTGQLSGNEVLLGLQTAYSGDSIEASVQLTRRLNRNETSLEAAFDHINPVADDAYLAGREVVGAAGERIDPILEGAEAGVSRATQQAEVALASVPEVGEQAAGREMRAQFLAARDQAKAAEVKAYSDYQEAYGLRGAQSEVRIPISEGFRAHINNLDKERVNAIFAGQATGKSQLLSEAFLEGEIDLHQLEEGIKYLRRVLRKQGTTVAADAPTRDVIRLKDEMVLLRNEYLEATNPALLALAENAEAAAAKRAQDFDKGVLGAIIQKKDGQYMLNDTRVFAYVIKSNDEEAAQHFARIVGQDPGAMVAAKGGLWSLYKKQVAPEGLPDPKLHKKFMRDHDNVINALFSEAEVKRMNQLGDMGKVVERAAQRYSNLVKGLKQTFAGKIRDTSPENLTSTVFSRNFSAVETRRLTDMLDAGGAGDQFREAVGTYVRNKIFTNNRINANNIDRLLQRDGEKLKNIFGPEYVQNLHKIHEASLMINQTAKGLVPRKTNAFTDLMRVLFAPPLTQRGRAQTLVVNLRSDAAKRAIGEAVMDPKKLEAIVRLEAVDRNSKRAARAMSALGGYSVFADE
jgi:hypothetical protein